MNYRTEDEVRDSAKLILGFDKTEPKVKQGTGEQRTGHRPAAGDLRVFPGVSEEKSEELQGTI